MCETATILALLASGLLMINIMLMYKLIKTDNEIIKLIRDKKPDYEITIG